MVRVLPGARCATNVGRTERCYLPPLRRYPMQGSPRKGPSMSKYLITGSYAAEGVKGLMQEGGSKRLAAATAAIESVGGSIDSFYYAFGTDDVVGICDFPDAFRHRSNAPCLCRLGRRSSGFRVSELNTPLGSHPCRSHWTQCPCSAGRAC